MEFTHTVFPEPVAPAIKRCGISVKSAITGCPDISLPKAKVNFDCKAPFMLMARPLLYRKETQCLQKASDPEHEILLKNNGRDIFCSPRCLFIGDRA